MIFILYVFFGLNFFALMALTLGTPLWRWNFDMIFLTLGGFVYNSILLVLSSEVKSLKGKLERKE
jgi:hypothetical protein